MRTWRMAEPISGSYVGRIAPPGRPNRTSVPSRSRARSSASAPFIRMAIDSSSWELHERGLAGDDEATPSWVAPHGTRLEQLACLGNRNDRAGDGRVWDPCRGNHLCPSV